MGDKFLSLWVCSLLLCASAHAIPGTVVFEGILKTGADVPVADGSHDVTFFLTTAENTPQSGAVWSEVHAVASSNPIVTSKGLFKASLSIPLSVLVANDILFVGVNAAGEDMHPRPQLSAVPFALRAGSVESLDGSSGGAVSGATTVTTSTQRAVTALRTYTGGSVVQPAIKGSNSGSGAGVYGENTYSGTDTNSAGLHGVRSGGGGAAVLAETDNFLTPALVAAGPGNFLEGRTTKDSPPTFWLDGSGSITVEHGSAPLMYAEGNTGDASNNSRYWIAHSRTYPNYGLFYNDAVDAVEFHRAGVPTASVNLLTGVGTFDTVNANNLVSSPFASIGVLQAGKVDVGDLTVSGTLLSTQLPRTAFSSGAAITLPGSEQNVPHTLVSMTVKPPGPGSLLISFCGYVDFNIHGDLVYDIDANGAVIDQYQVRYDRLDIVWSDLTMPVAAQSSLSVTSSEPVVISVTGSKFFKLDDVTVHHPTLSVTYYPNLPF